MSKFEHNQRVAFCFKNPFKIWINCNDFGMAKAMHDIIFNSTKVVIMQGGNFFSVNAYEVITMNK